MSILYISDLVFDIFGQMGQIMKMFGNCWYNEQWICNYLLEWITEWRTNQCSLSYKYHNLIAFSIVLLNYHLNAWPSPTSEFNYSYGYTRNYDGFCIKMSFSKIFVKINRFIHAKKIDEETKKFFPTPQYFNSKFCHLFFRCI